MSVEYEAKFLNIDILSIKEKLIKSNAKLEHSQQKFVRAAYSLCENQSNPIRGFVRVRDEGKKVTLTSKLYKDPKFPEENEISINEDFNTGVNFLNSLGIKKKAFQESYREKWSHPLVHEITFDIVPGLPIYMEIDCTSESNLNKVIELLNLNSEFKRFGAFDKTYLEYYGIETNVINDSTPFLTFANIKNEITPIKNLELFADMVELNSTIENHYANSTMDKYYEKYMKIYNTHLKTLNSKQTNLSRHRRPSKKSSKRSSKKSSKRPSKKSSKPRSKRSSKPRSKRSSKRRSKRSSKRRSKN
jgi:hypothetical protein